MRRMLEAFGEIDERYLVSAMMCERRPIKRWRLRVAALAACLCLVVTGVIRWVTADDSTHIDSVQRLYFVGAVDQHDDGSRTVKYVFSDVLDGGSTVTVNLTNGATEAWLLRPYALGKDGLFENRATLASKDSNGEYDVDVYINGERISRDSAFFDVDWGDGEYLAIPADGKEYEVTFDFSKYFMEHGVGREWRLFSSIPMFYEKAPEK